MEFKIYDTPRYVALQHASSFLGYQNATTIEEVLQMAEKILTYLEADEVTE